jgi:hypothetical protein
VMPVLQRLQDKRQTWWPIMAWGMYRESFPPRPITLWQRRLIGVNAEGAEQEIHHWQSGYSPFAFKRIFLKPMLDGESEAARRLAEKINLHLDVPIVAFRIESKLYTQTDTGIKEEDYPGIFFDGLH